MTDVVAADGASERDVPAGLRAWSRDRVDAEGDPRSNALAALDRARGLPGSDREGAWWLLAADALLTTAAEEALAADDPEEALGRLIVDAAAARG